VAWTKLKSCRVGADTILSIKNTATNQEIDMTTSPTEVKSILGEQTIFEVFFIPPEEEDDAEDVEPPKKIQKLEDAILAQPKVPVMETEEDDDDDGSEEKEVEIVDPMTKVFVGKFDGQEIAGQVRLRTWISLVTRFSFLTLCSPLSLTS
jgi:hypothetical protein